MGKSRWPGMGTPNGGQTLTFRLLIHRALTVLCAFWVVRCCVLIDAYGQGKSAALCNRIGSCRSALAVDRALSQRLDILESQLAGLVANDPEDGHIPPLAGCLESSRPWVHSQLLAQYEQAISQGPTDALRLNLASVLLTCLESAEFFERDKFDELQSTLSLVGSDARNTTGRQIRERALRRQKERVVAAGLRVPDLWIQTELALVLLVGLMLFWHPGSGEQRNPTVRQAPGQPLESR